MAKFYPSYQTLRLADQILEAIAARIPGYQGCIGARWYWRLTGGRGKIRPRWRLCRVKYSEHRCRIRNKEGLAGLNTSTMTTRIDRRWRRALPAAVWLAVALAFLAVYTLDLGLSYNLISRPCDGTDCHYQAVSSAEAQALAELGLSVQAYALYMLGITVVNVAVFFTLALVMVWRLYPRIESLLYSAMLIIIPTTTITSFDVVAAAYPAWAGLINLLFILGLAATVSFFLVFPNGRLAPRSLVAVLVFMAAGVFTASLLRHWLGVPA